MAIDLFGASANIWIRSAGQSIPIENLFGDAVKYIERVRVKIGLLKLLEVEVTLVPPIEKAFNILRSGKIGIGFTVTKTSGQKASVDIESADIRDFTLSANSMAVQLSYGGITSRVFETILITPEISIGVDGISITLKGIGFLFPETKRTKSESYEGKTPEEVVRDILGSDVMLQIDSDAKSKLNVKGKDISVSRNNYEAAREILKEHGCFMVDEGKSNINDGKTLIRIKSYDKMRRDKRGVATFVAYQQINPNQGIYPILDMRASITNMLLPKGAFGQQQFIFDRESKSFSEESIDARKATEISSSIPSGDNTVAGGARQGAITSNGGSTGFSGEGKVGGVIPGLGRGVKKTTDQVVAMVHDYISKVFQYEIESIGVVNLLPGRMVNVGIANIKELSGLYDLIEVEHTLGSDGVTTNLSLARTAGFLSSLSEGVSNVTSNIISSNTDNKPKISTPSGVQQ
jgi:hypothetical protein